MNKVLVVAAHPDDEVLGCGGTIAKHTKNGDNVKIIIMGEGETSRQTKRDKLEAGKLLQGLSKAATEASKILGAEEVELVGLPDNRLDSIERLEITKLLEARINDYKPRTIYVHHSGDVNVDHRRLHEAVITACRPTPGQSVRQILSYEVASSTEWQTPGSGTAFQPNWFVDISLELESKAKALKVYRSEMRNWPHARSYKALENQARYRGAQIGVDAAEAFMLMRNIL